MKKKILAAMFISVAILTGCRNEANSDVIMTIEPESSVSVGTEIPATPEVSEESTQPMANNMWKGVKIIKDRKIVDGKMQSYLTGEWKDASVVQRRNFAVMVPNNKPALPQYGISKASIFYEAPMESGSCTRLMPIVEDYDDLDHIGPVRSSREYFLYESQSYDSIYCNWGLAVPYVAPTINREDIHNVSQAVTGIDSPSTEAFDRISRPGYSLEFTGYMFISGYKKAIERHKYDTNYRDTFEQAFIFADDGNKAEYSDYPDATLLKPGGDASNSGGYNHANPYFKYNPEDGLYYRYQLGKPHTDDMNGEQLAVSNVIFKVCHGEILDDHGYLGFEVHAIGGEAYIFTNGKVIKGNWNHVGDFGANHFYDDEGDEVVLNQGKTWICLIWDKYKDCVSYE
ncbi:MAG: DUF3048 domain-containing protein [Lachnospiraceae bacterium]|nr:DUF3048 domain-containing protein [Lachnospiraceae bacterium]